MKQTQPIKFTVRPEQAQIILRDAYNVDINRAIPKAKFNSVELIEVEQLLHIINEL
jgi:hypothetical protein